MRTRNMLRVATLNPRCFSVLQPYYSGAVLQITNTHQIFYYKQ